MTPTTFVMGQVCMHDMYVYAIGVFHFSSEDSGGRYAYDKQPEVCRWNLRKLGEALAPGGLKEEMIKEGLAECVLMFPVKFCELCTNDAVHRFDSVFATAYLGKMRQKVGMFVHIRTLHLI